MDFDLDLTEARCLGSLIEKSLTTPDQYPMSLNGVRVACNQSTNRYPVVAYDEPTVERALRRLADRGIVKMVHRPGDRVVKYRHAADEVLELDPKELVVVGVLLLRGPQTPGEIRQRTSRWRDFESLGEVERTLESLAGRHQPLIRRQDRVPGQKEHRYSELLADDSESPQPSSDTVRSDTTATEAVPPPSEIEDLREEVAELKGRFRRLLDALGVEDI